MYRFKDEYKNKEVVASLAKSYKGKDKIAFDDASQDELEHLYNLGFVKFIEKEENEPKEEIEPKEKKVRKSKK